MGLACLAMGTGGLDVVMAMAGGVFIFLFKSHQINLEGSLMPWISAKDVVLKVLSILGKKEMSGRLSNMVVQV